MVRYSLPAPTPAHMAGTSRLTPASAACSFARTVVCSRPLGAGALAVSSADLVRPAWKSAPSAVWLSRRMPRGPASPRYLAEGSRGGIGDGEAPAA